MRYGAANTTGRPGTDEAQRILNLAVKRGVETLDTAQSYGDSEARVGRWLDGRTAPRVVTKLAPQLDVSDLPAVLDAASASRSRIGPALEGVLLHEPSKLDAWPKAASTCMDAGLVTFAGVSVYEPAEFARALEREELTAIQAPYSIADRRLENDGLLERARARGVRLFLRSAFLQGVLLMHPVHLPKRLGFLAPSVARWRAACERLGLRPQEAALGWVKARAPHAEVVVGAETVEQLGDTLDAWERASLDEATCELLADTVGSLASAAVDPRRWPTR
jgi:aryl-alcohol dehydrogenase-like predicted oxidoreductase